MRNYKGKNNPNYRHGNRSQDHHTYCPCGKEINSRAKHCRKCQNIRQKELIKGKNNPNFNKIFSKKTLEKMHEAKQGIYEGSNNPNWQGGTSFEPYTSEWTSELRESIRDRDNHTCQLCNKTEIELNETLNIHHIDYNKKNCKDENLISLCQSCHSKTNGNRKFWTEYFTNLILQLI